MKNVLCRVSQTGFLVALILLLLTSCEGQKIAVGSKSTTKETTEKKSALEQQFSLENIEYVDYEPVLPETWELENGLTVMFLRDDELPLVRGSLMIKGGSLWEPKDQPGVVSAMGSQMRHGGAGEMGPEELDIFLENLSAEISSSFDGENGTISFSSLSLDFEVVFSVFADVVFNPRFDESRLALWKGQTLEGIRRRVDNPGTIASISFNQLMYPESPYGRVLTSPDIERISRNALIEAHEEFIKPDGAILILSGPLEREDVEAKVNRYFEQWRARGGTLGPPPAIDAEPASGIYFLSMPFSQSTIYMGHQGVPRLTEDHVAIDALNHIFGTGGFTARLTRRIRSELGFAYSVYGAILPGIVKGRNLIYVQTKAESTGDAVVESLKVLKGMQKENVSEVELEETKHSIESSFVFRLDSPDKVLSRQAILQLREYPANYDTDYLETLRELQPSEIREAAKKRWDPERFVILIVGNEDAYVGLEEALSVASEPLRSMEIKRVTFHESLVFDAAAN